MPYQDRYTPDERRAYNRDYYQQHRERLLPAQIERDRQRRAMTRFFAHLTTLIYHLRTR
jgi:hypothetical protein